MDCERVCGVMIMEPVMEEEGAAARELRVLLPGSLLTPYESGRRLAAIITGRVGGGTSGLTDWEDKGSRPTHSMTYSQYNSPTMKKDGQNLINTPPRGN